MISVRVFEKEEVLIKRSKCPACGGRSSMQLFIDKYNSFRIACYIIRKFGVSKGKEVLKLIGDYPYELRKCDECSVVYQSHIFSDFYMNVFYDNWLMNHDMETELDHKEIEGWRARKMANEIHLLASMINKPTKDIRILDYGMGEGWFCRVAQSFGFYIKGTDIAVSLVNRAISNGINALYLHEIDAYRFDVINTEQVFEHLPNPLETLNELARLLNPGGIIKISVPNGTNIESRLHLMNWKAPRHSKQFLIPCTPLGHINTFNLEAIRAMGEKAGLKFEHMPLKWALLDFTSSKAAVRSILSPFYLRFKKHTCCVLRAPG